LGLNGILSIGFGASQPTGDLTSQEDRHRSSELEHNIGVSNLGQSPSSVQSEQASSIQAEAITDQEAGMASDNTTEQATAAVAQPRAYYRFEWFWFLVIVDLVFTSTAALGIITVSILSISESFYDNVLIVWI